MSQKCQTKCLFSYYGQGIVIEGAMSGHHISYPVRSTVALPCENFKRALTTTSACGFSK